jgi:Tol biopolymer transport system component
MTRNGALYYETGGSRDNVFVAEVNRDLMTDRHHRGEVEEFVNFNSSASWSPDGKSLAYISRRNRKSALVIQSWETRKSREVPAGISPYNDTPVIWFPDGLSVLVTGTEPAKDGKRPNGFYRVNLAHGETQLVHPQACAYYDLSRTGEVLYYVQNNPVTHKWAGQLTRFDIQTGVDTALKRTEAEQLVTSVAVSPDGKQLAYILRNDNTRESSLEVMPSGGGDSRELFRGPWEGPSTAAGIAWSSDQRYLLFVRGVSAPGGSEVSVYRIPAAGGNPVNTGISFQGSFLATMKFPSISPDGLRIAYQTHEDGREVRALENFLPKAAAR